MGSSADNRNADIFLRKWAKGRRINESNKRGLQLMKRCRLPFWNYFDAFAHFPRDAETRQSFCYYYYTDSFRIVRQMRYLHCRATEIQYERMDYNEPWQISRVMKPKVYTVDTILEGKCPVQFECLRLFSQTASLSRDALFPVWWLRQLGSWQDKRLFILRKKQRQGHIYKATLRRRTTSYEHCERRLI